MTIQPDIFTNVHKGIRSALFAACSALGRADEGSAEHAAARGVTRDALRFVAHHGENEDALLLPLLHERIPAVAARIVSDHHAIESALGALSALLDTARAIDLYHEVCAFTARYLGHMRAEELEFEPAIRAALSTDDLAGYARRAVERASSTDQRMMLGWMVPAITAQDAKALLGRLPEGLANELRAQRRL